MALKWTRGGGRNGKPVKIRGTEYPSMTAAAKALGVSRSVVWQAKSEGRLDTVGTGVNATPCIIHGKEYPSIMEASRQLNVNPRSISRLLDLGRVSELVPGERYQPALMRRVGLVWDGVEYRSIREAAIALGINYSTFLDRVKARNHHEAPRLRREVKALREEIKRLKLELADEKSRRKQASSAKPAIRSTQEDLFSSGIPRS